ncbi:MAG: OB-fold domain-containing protein [Deltaproteobacteria bacterium]|nr:OB-fold domain-containing protein [Deltaproteobacteria bacterium]MBI3077139.1 OB-fold domain-containing protein [Deltaproteobacteria bacterium]
MSEVVIDLPVLDPDSKPFWESCRRHEMALQRCAACGQFRFPPRVTCPHCLSEEYTWTPVRGRGTVYTFVTFHHVYHKAWADKAPYNVSMIELEEGPRLWSNVVGIAPEEVTVGMPVEIFYEDVTDEVALPKFRPAGR